MMRKIEGFTLIELMIVVVVVSILAAIAYPSYTEHMMKGRRADAKSGLIQVQMAQEKWRANNISYTTNLANLGFTAEGGVFYSPDKNYQLSVTAADGASYTATAAPTGKQSGDKCGTFQITQAGVKSVSGAASGYDETTCW